MIFWVPLSAAGFLPGWELKGDVGADLTASYFYTTNVFGNASEESDAGQSVVAGADYTREAGRYGLFFRVEARATRFDEFSGEDYINPLTRLQLRRLRGRATGEIELLYSRENRADEMASRRITEERWGATLNGMYQVNSRNAIRTKAGAGYHRFPDELGAVELRIGSAGADWVRVYSSKLQYFGGYRYRLTKPYSGNDSHDHAVSVGAVGDVLPKVTGEVRAGVQSRVFSGDRSSSESLHSALSLTWAARPRVTAGLTGSRDFHTNAFDQSIDVTAADLDLRVQVGAKTTTIAGAGYSYFSFLDEARRDHLYRLRWRLEYSINRYLSTGGEVTWTRSDSSEVLADYRTVFSQVYLRARF